MNWILRSISRLRRFCATRRREALRYNLEFILSRLDDRMLVHIDVPRDRIAEYAEDVAHKAVAPSGAPGCGRADAYAGKTPEIASVSARIANDNPSLELCRPAGACR